MVKVNGKETDAAGKSVSELLALGDYLPTHVAVEINEVIIPKAEYDTTTTQDDDVVEIVSFVGGG